MKKKTDHWVKKVCGLWIEGCGGGDLVMVADWWQWEGGGYLEGGEYRES